MAFIYGKTTSDFMATFAPILRDNCLDGMIASSWFILTLLAMQTILGNMAENGGVPESLKAQAEEVQSAEKLDGGMLPFFSLSRGSDAVATAEKIVAIWNEKALQSALQPTHFANIQGGLNGAKFYFENARRFAPLSYVPDRHDVLMARRKTVGIIETHFQYGPNRTAFTLVDVGGQRSERKKWLHCFQSVTAVIYLTAINEYDMVLEEDSSCNRLLESLKLWKALTSSKFFKETPFILFLNKSDLFAQKLQKTPLGDIFADYDQVASSPEFEQYHSTYEKSWQYILKQFRTHFEGRSFYPHVTNVLDSELCQKVFVSVQESVVKATVNLLI
jgi:guanine nucleotide-binding protein subunit alpha